MTCERESTELRESGKLNSSFNFATNRQIAWPPHSSKQGINLLYDHQENIKESETMFVYNNLKQ